MAPQDLPKRCNECGSPFSISHALQYKKDGLFWIRHDNIFNKLADLAVIGWQPHAVRLEPMIISHHNLAGKITDYMDNAIVPEQQDVTKINTAMQW